MTTLRHWLPIGPGIEIDAEFQLQRTRTDTRLRILALLEGKTGAGGFGVLTVDGQEIALQSADPTPVSSPPSPRYRNPGTFWRAPSRPAAERVSLHVVTEDPAAAISIWVWEDRPGP